MSKQYHNHNVEKIIYCFLYKVISIVTYSFIWKSHIEKKTISMFSAHDSDKSLGLLRKLLRNGHADLLLKPLYSSEKASNLDLKLNFFFFLHKLKVLRGDKEPSR